ncbi:MAG TPA: hypothetical protein VGI43_12935 [Mucilaginibacter sp.]|jgi:hypothetical protein
MNKLLKPIFGILFIVAFSQKSSGQLHYRTPAPVPHGVPMQHGVPLNQLNRPNPGRKIERVKETYISKQLNLTPEQSRAFWPLYRQYVEDQTAVRILKRQNNSTASPDGTEQIDKELEYEQQLVEIRKHYRDEFLKILPPEKVSELYKSERQFNDEMLNILKERTIRGGN